MLPRIEGVRQFSIAYLQDEFDARMSHESHMSVTKM
jgi:hypothetical protein